jgi:SPP1 family holin
MDTMTKVRTTALVITWVNMILSHYGLQPIPFVSDEDISMVLAGISTVYAWFYNNYVTAKGKRQKEVLRINNLTK